MPTPYHPIFHLMYLLAICILFNAYIGVIFKLFDRYGVRNLQAIVLNYFVCTATASVMMGSPAVSPSVMNKPWFVASLMIGFAFVLTFNLFAKTVQSFGVVTGSIFQKMSLIAPVMIAIIWYGESASLLKVLGIALSVASILVISLSKQKMADNDKSKADRNGMLWLFPIGTLIGSCFIDSSLFYVDRTGLASSLDIDFLASLFFFAGCFGAVLAIKQWFVDGIGYRKKDIIAGFALGIPNFFSIYFLLKVLSNGMDGSVVFPINNVGILVCTALMGILLFGEKMTMQKSLGFAMAVLAIVLMALA